MALLNVDVGRTLSVGLPSELDIKRLICALLAGDINNLLKGPLICINTHIDDLIGRLPSNVLTDALRNLQYGLGDMLQQSGINDTLGRLNSATSQLESLFGLGGICPVPFTLPRIGNVLGDMVAGYMGAAGNIISDIAQFEQALSHVCIGTGGIGPDWGNMTGGILSRLNQDINTFGGGQIPENVMAQYIAQLDQSAAAISGISARMAGGVGSDAANVAAAASTAFQLTALYNKVGDYPVQDGNIVYDNVFKMFLDPNVYDAMLAAANPGTPLITKEQSVLDNCGRPIATKTVVVQGDLLTQPFDATVDAVQTPIPTPALGDFTLYQPDMETNVFAVNLLPGDNPDIHLIKGRSYLIKLDLGSLKFYVYRPSGTANPPGGEYQKPHLVNGDTAPASSNLYSTGMIFEDGAKGDQAQGKQMGFLTWNIPTDAPDQLQYRDAAGAVTGNIYLRNVEVSTGTGGGGGGTSIAFGKVIVPGSGTITASTSDDSLIVAAGDGITLTTNPGTKTLTITSTGGTGGYTLPIATTTRLGGVKVDGTTITVDANGVITSTSGSYVLPTASTTVLGGVKVDGTTITINGNGVITGANTYTLPTASTTVLGGVKLDGTTITINGSGVISAHGISYTLPIATASVLGGVKVDNSTIHIDPTTGLISYTLPHATTSVIGGVKVDGTTITISVDGTISATGGGGGGYTLPPASTSTRGGVRIDGTTITISNTDVISARQYTLPTASNTTLGGVKVDGTTITIDGNGFIKYTLPTATTSVLGGVKIDGTTVTINGSGVISAPYNYTLPTASTTILGGVKIDGTTVTINGSGVISSNYTLPTASTTILGGVKIDGTTVTINGSGVISAPYTYTLPTASTTVLGGVKIDGTTVTISGTGVISAPLPVATTTVLGGVKVDGTTITVSPSGVITAVSGSSSVSFGTIHVSGQTDIVAPTASSVLNLAAGTGGITLTTNATSRTLTVENSLTAANLTSTSITGATNYGLFRAKSTNQLQFRSLIGTSGISIVTSADGNALVLSATDQTTAANMGTGYGVFKEKVGNQLNFRSIKAGTGVTVTSDGDTITVSSPSVQYVLSGTATTTDASATTISWGTLLTMPTDSSWFFEVTFIGRRTDGTVERNAFKLEGVYDNTSGTVSLLGPAAKTTYQNTATNWNVGTSVSGTTGQPIFYVFGEVGKNVKWTAWLRYQQVSDV